MKRKRNNNEPQCVMCDGKILHIYLNKYKAEKQFYSFFLFLFERTISVIKTIKKKQKFHNTKWNKTLELVVLSHCR